MVDQPSEIIYLEPDDEITAVVRRLRESTAPRVVLVSSGRTKATSSAVALRLLAQIARDEGRAIALVAEPSARALAGEAGIDAFSSVAEAEADGAAPAPTPAPRRASIRVVRQADAPAVAPPLAAPAPPPAVGGPGDETRAVPVVGTEPASTRPAGSGWLRRLRGRPSLRRGVLVALLAVLLVGAAALAAILPAATITITPATAAVGPRTYTVEPEVEGPETATLTATESGTPSGDRVEEIAASGTVTFYNWNTVDVSVPAGTIVSAGGDITFSTQEGLTVPHGDFSGSQLVSGEGSVAVKAEKPGPSGNVAASSIDTVESRVVAAFLRGFPSLSLRLVTNDAAMSGGDEVHHTVVQQEDVVAVVAAVQGDIQTEIAARLAQDPDRIYPPADPGEIVVDVPGDLVGTEDLDRFELSASYQFSRVYVTRAAAESAAQRALQADSGAVPSGQTLLPDSVSVTLGDAQQSGDTISVAATVSARSAAQVDLDAARQAVMGMTREEAQSALRGLGSVQVDLWPGWVDRIPRLDWRVRVELSGG